MAQRRINIVTAVNAANVSKSGNVYTVRDVVHAVDGIVLNRRMYPGNELKKAVKGLNGKPAPAGHPKDGKGRHISATNGEALAAAWIGAYCQNSRYEGGRAMVDIVINGDQAKALDAGRRVIERLDAAIAGTNAEPIGVSSGLFLEEVAANGKSLGKEYSAIATNMAFDHIAILLDETPAGTPEEGVGMFLNSQGEEEEIETVTINAEPEDARSKGMKAWLMRLIGNGSVELSFDQISSGLYALLPRDAWIREVYDRYCIWSDGQGNNYRQDYSVGSDGSLAFSSDPQAVKREVSYVPITNSQEVDQVKETIIAALNAAGISGVAAMTDAQLLEAYNAVQAKPHIAALNAETAKLTEANGKLAAFELAANAAKDAELTALATELAANTSLKPEDFKAMGLERCKELKAANKKAAPVNPGAGNGGGEDEFKGYSLNAHFEEKK